MVEDDLRFIFIKVMDSVNDIFASPFLEEEVLYALKMIIHLKLWDLIAFPLYSITIFGR